VFNYAQASINSITATGNTVTFSDNNLPADGTFLYTARQIVGNAASLQSAALVVKIDNTAPIVTVNQGGGQADPTNIQPINFTVLFNENVSGFDSQDVSLAGSTAGVSAANIVMSGGGTTYTVKVSNITGDGNIVFGILQNSVQDLAGNSVSASINTDNTVTLDSTPPTVTINQSASQIEPTRTMPLNFAVVFSEPVTGFSNADISLAGSTADVSSASVVVTGSGTT